MKKTIKITKLISHPLLGRGLWGLFVFIFLLTACEREIEMDYRTIDKIYVIEANLTNESTMVYITTTRDMDDNRKGQGVSDAVVKLTGDDGYNAMLYHSEDGYYQTLNRFTGRPGTTYKLSVNVGGKEFTSQSTMHERIHIETIAFQLMELFSYKIMTCSPSFVDTPGEDNYYMYRIYRNYELVSWSTFNDKGHDGEMTTVNLRMWMGGNNSDDETDNIFREGDDVTIELHVINKAVYDYYYSLALSESTSSNPIDNFEGGCLGYFSAHPITRYSFVFSEDLPNQ